MKYLIAIIMVALLAGCATNYKEQLAAYQAVETKRADAVAAKYTALSAIAAGADASTRQVALQAWQATTMAETLGGGRQNALEPMPQPPETAFDKTLRTLKTLAPIASAVAGNVYQYRLGAKQSDNMAAVSLGDQRARVDSLSVVGNNNAAIARAGFESLQGLAARPTSIITVTGDHNAVASIGSTATTTKNCTTGGTAPGGNGGTSGASGNGGNGAPGTTTGGAATGGNGAGSGATAPTGQGGQSGPTGSNGC